MSSIFDFLGGASSGGTSILLQALGAAMRGESPQAFMKRLASQHPQLKRLNLDDLQGTANQLCQQNGLNPNDVAKQVDSVISPHLNK
jgi:hypothetical protein